MESSECPNALAKQVLSQLSYTPTSGTFLILKHMQPFENLKPTLCASCIKQLSPEPCFDGGAVTPVPLAILGFFPRIQDQYSSARDVSRVAGYESQVVL
jgi:hypothetical protein